MSSVYQTLQTFMGGALVNYFNRFGRQWQVYVQSEGSYRTTPQNLGKFYVNNSSGPDGTAQHPHRHDTPPVALNSS